MIKKVTQEEIAIQFLYRKLTHMEPYEIIN